MGLQKNSKLSVTIPGQRIGNSVQFDSTIQSPGSICRITGLDVLNLLRADTGRIKVAVWLVEAETELPIIEHSSILMSAMWLR